MKKLLFVLLLSVLLVGCGEAEGSKSESKSVSMEEVVTALESNGAELEADKPAFGLIGAVDGAMLYSEGNPVKVYKFDDAKELKKAQEMLPGTVANGLILLETSDESSIDAFNDIE